MRARTRRRQAASQAAFQAMFNHTPRIDVRTPAQVKAQKAAEHWLQDK